MARTNKVSMQDDKTNQLMSGEEIVQNGEGAAAGEDVQNETDNEDQETEDSLPSGERQEQPEDNSPGGENQEQPEPVSQILTATYPILYLSHQYRIGDTLPANDPEMVKAWLAAKTAAWTPAGAGKEGSGK